MSVSLHPLFEPRTVAVVGASRHPKKLGSIILRNILKSGFRGVVYPVNPTAQTIEGLPVYAEFAHIPEIPDLAIIVVPAALVLDVVKQIALKGTKHLVIISAGFKESGAEGENREAALVQLAREYELAILGPNCLGFVNTVHRLNATFGATSGQIGNLRFISQSGAIASSIFDWATGSKVGFSDFVTLGNKAVITENDVLEYWLAHPRKPETIATDRPDSSAYHPIGMYLESVENGARFVELAKEVTKTSPLFVLKPGKSSAAQKAMQSHTGAIAGDDAVFSQALRQAGVIRCEGIEDVFDFSRAFSWSNTPDGPDVAIVSNAGGPAVFSSDAVVAEGLRLAKLSDHTKELLARHLPREASLLNPVDVLGDALADRYEKAIRLVFEENKVDALVVLLTPQVLTQIEETARVIGRLSQRYKKPIFCSFMGGSEISKGEVVLTRYRIPFFRYPERAIRALGKMWWWQSFRRTQGREKQPLVGVDVPFSAKKEVLTLLETEVRIDQPYLDPMKVQQIFDYWDIPTPATAVVANLEQAKQFAKKEGFPVVMKLVAPELLHKTEVGGVITAIGGTKQLEKSSQLLIQRLTELPSTLKKTAKIQIQSQVSSGVEVIVGIKKNAQFGNVLMVGAGGVLVELINDRNMRLLPVSKREVRELVEQSKVFSLLKGYRGESEYAIERLYHLITQLIDLVQTVPYFKEIEINPVIVTKDEAVAVDGKVVLIDI